MTGGSWYEKTSGTGNGNSDGSERTDGCVGASAGKSAVAPETKQEVAKSSAENGGSESAEASDGSVSGEITVMVSSAFTAGTDDPAIMRAVKAFEEQNPGTKVTIEGLTGQELLSKFTTTAMAGSGVDVVALDNSGWPIDLAAMGLIMPLDDQDRSIGQQVSSGTARVRTL